ncbi:hypothetical protein HBH98_143090 [Parastagonospora nodorum]|nr:hypothetical protein HBH47_142290 [Parastagonospora nodorum]KAH4344042.1 hypothetical protein HBH98_143090 [Parastagonospora nodorum]KAH4372233.1 hypothetical protein HBH97_135470 [Parastagonospora nodorum]KAH4376428.1 hypothetical protein HBH99_212300 [Parastagonospora nodorum]KAH5048672.1 hypothetical protein HBH96_209100 [Parastagonospora nodorum]
MDKIPAELIDHISSLLEHNDLKNTLLVSKALSFAAEKHSHVFDEFALYEGNADKFLKTYCGHRFSYLRVVEIWTKLPRVEDGEMILRESAEQLLKNDLSMTRQIKFLFNTIESAEQRAGEQGNSAKILLNLPDPGRYISNVYGSIDYPQHLSWRAHLLDPDSLPSLQSVRYLQIGVGSRYPFERTPKGYTGELVKLDYRVIVDIATKCPNLQYLGCELGYNEWQRKWMTRGERYLSRDWAGPRRDTRKDFAQALESANLPKSLRHISLNFLHPIDDVTRIDHNDAHPNMVFPATSDPFSTSLHHFSQNLRRINLCVIADESLFWPEADRVTSWPNLESFVVMFHMVSPSGKWYFHGPNDEGRNAIGFEVNGDSYPSLEASDLDVRMWEEVQRDGHLQNDQLTDRFRIIPNDSILRPFLKGFACAAAQMLSLKEAVLWCPLSWERWDDWTFDGDEGEGEERNWLGSRFEQELAWGIQYLRAGEKEFKHRRKLSLETPHLWWKVSKWRPDPELHDLFHKIVCQPQRGDLVEHWVDETSGQKLVGRDQFEDFMFQEPVYR